MARSGGDVQNGLSVIVYWVHLPTRMQQIAHLPWQTTPPHEIKVIRHMSFEPIRRENLREVKIIPHLCQVVVAHRLHQPIGVVEQILHPKPPLCDKTHSRRDS
jgi:hypothetical protein